MASRRIQDPAAFGREARDASWKILGRKAINVDWPASRSRRSVRVEFADGSVIATRRKRPERSQLEAIGIENTVRLTAEDDVRTFGAEQGVHAGAAINVIGGQEVW